MASKPLPPEYLRAGEDYLAALQKLGLNPEVLGWGTEITTGDWHLVMLTSIVEIGGPFELNKLLFAAYNMGATPKEISPFIVRVFGDRTVFAPGLRQLSEFQRGDKKITAYDQYTRKEKASGLAESMSMNFGDIHIESRDLYIAQISKKGHEQKTREWLRFKHNVERLAA